MINIREESIDIIHMYQDGPADGVEGSVGGEASCHAASRLVHGGQIDLGRAENVTKMSVAKNKQFSNEDPLKYIIFINAGTVTFLTGSG